MTRVADRVVSTLTDRLDRKRTSRRSFLVKTAVVGSALAVNPVAVSAATRNRVRVAVRPGGRLCVGVDGVLLHDQQQTEHVSAGHARRGLVESRQLRILWRQGAVLRRLQRQVHEVRMRCEWNLRLELPRVQVRVRERHVRRTARVLQRVPLRPMPPRSRVRRAGRMPGCVVCSAVALRRVVLVVECNRERDGTARRSVPARHYRAPVRVRRREERGRTDQAVAGSGGRHGLDRDGQGLLDGRLRRRRVRVR